MQENLSSYSEGHQATSVTGVQIIIHPWVCHIYIILPIKKMTNPNPNQRRTQIKYLSVTIGRCSLDSQNGGPSCILRMLAVLISGTKTMTKVASQQRDTNGKDGLERTTKMYMTVILRKFLHKESLGKE